jgi:fatty-acid desaturase
MNAKPAELPVSEGPAAPAKVVNALRLQRRLALAVVIVPILGTLIAIVLVIKNGIGFVEIGSFAVMYLLTMGGVTIGFHRYFAHKCFDAGPITSLVLGVLGSMAAQGPIISWVTVHRKHHAFSDRPGDPHSPHISRGRNLGGLVGLWHAHIGWMLSENFTEWVNFARDLMADRLIFRIQRMYFLWVALGLALPAAGAGLLSRSWAGAGLGWSSPLFCCESIQLVCRFGVSLFWIAAVRDARSQCQQLRRRDAHFWRGLAKQSSRLSKCGAAWHRMVGARLQRNANSSACLRRTDQEPESSHEGSDSQVAKNMSAIIFVSRSECWLSLRPPGLRLDYVQKVNLSYRLCSRSRV